MSVIYEPRGPAREYAPLAANLYRGCGHGCSYCYAPAATRTDRERFVRPEPRARVLGQLERDAARLAGDRRDVLLSFTCDPYQPLDAELGLTRQAIQILHRHRLAVTVLTKGGYRARRDLDLLAEDPRSSFGVTLTFADPARSQAWEPGAALPVERLDSLTRAKAAGIHTWASLEPVIDPAETLELIRWSWPWVDLYRVGKWNHDARARAIDWPAFREAAEAELRRLGKAYTIKQALREG